MSEIPTVTQALSRVVAELPPITKGERADPRQGGYAYRGIEQITRAVQPLFARHGIVCVPSVEHWQIDPVRVGDKEWADVKLLVRYRVYGPGGDSIEVGPFLAIGRDGSDKGANKCMTQAFKYMLLQLLCISDAEDDGDAVTVEAEQISSARPVRQAAPPEEDGAPFDDPPAPRRRDTHSTVRKPPGGAASEKQVRLIAQLLSERGSRSKEDAREIIGEIIHRPIAGAHDLSGQEASEVITTLMTIPPEHAS